jgi:hypothetical protein
MPALVPAAKFPRSWALRPAARPDIRGGALGSSHALRPGVPLGQASRNVPAVPGADSAPLRKARRSLWREYYGRNLVSKRINGPSVGTKTHRAGPGAVGQLGAH